MPKWKFYFTAFVILIAVMFIVGFVQTLLHPPVEIIELELPAIVKRELDKYFPAFQPAKIFLGEIGDDTN